ncbi:hypothetical protein NCCP2716_05710 [Sporosarcina sp. NCCP-2716]|uniref:hypothetical protein n=1 Tax=Sporosarcina sp. NCCP-2716 TaxID=2943679 RepID=UPI002040192B|nr:hypothetical protein [Sporosarcina sp. NCCP-2716]GKV68073.1 hypothetical protein NCCP2716_05710 [Sporosarcina sp. NCCP-2716]
MRFLIAALAVFALIYMLKSDLTEGTIHLAAFASEEPDCRETDKPASIIVTAVAGDTIESLFALYPDPSAAFLDRLAAFYRMNPHLQLQHIVGGEQIELPLSSEIVTVCTEA